MSAAYSDTIAGTRLFRVSLLGDRQDAFSDITRPCALDFIRYRNAPYKPRPLRDYLVIAIGRPGADHFHLKKITRPNPARYVLNSAPM